jgi:hypothetical protein
MRGKKCAVRRAQCAEKAADKGVTFEEAGFIVSLGTLQEKSTVHLSANRV